LPEQKKALGTPRTIYKVIYSN